MKQHLIKTTKKQNIGSAEPHGKPQDSTTRPPELHNSVGRCPGICGKARPHRRVPKAPRLPEMSGGCAPAGSPRHLGSHRVAVAATRLRMQAGPCGKSASSAGEFGGTRLAPRPGPHGVCPLRSSRSGDSLLQRGTSRGRLTAENLLRTLLSKFPVTTPPCEPLAPATPEGGFPASSTDTASQRPHRPAGPTRALSKQGWTQTQGEGSLFLDTRCSSRGPGHSARLSFRYSLAFSVLPVVNLLLFQSLCYS